VFPNATSFTKMQRVQTQLLSKMVLLCIYKHNMYLYIVILILYTIHNYFIGEQSYFLGKSTYIVFDNIHFQVIFFNYITTQNI